MPLRPKSTKVFGPRGVGYMVTDAAGNQHVVPFADASDLFPTGGNAGLVPPLPESGGGDTWVLTFNDITNVYEWIDASTVVAGTAVIPLTDGAEPPTLISDGTGGLIVVDYEP